MPARVSLSSTAGLTSLHFTSLNARAQTNVVRRRAAAGGLLVPLGPACVHPTVAVPVNEGEGAARRAARSPAARLNFWQRARSSLSERATRVEAHKDRPPNLPTTGTERAPAARRRRAVERRASRAPRAATGVVRGARGGEPGPRAAGVMCGGAHRAVRELFLTACPAEPVDGARGRPGRRCSRAIARLAEVASHHLPCDARAQPPRCASRTDIL